MDCERTTSDVDEGGVVRGSSGEDTIVGDGEEDCRLVHKGASTRIYRLRDPNNATFGGRTGLVAVKVLSPSVVGHPVTTPGDLRGLYDEYILSRRPNSLLSKCSAVRAALRHAKTRDGLPAIYLEWADGVTLREWTRVHFGGRMLSSGSGPPVVPRRRSYWCGVVSLARKIAAALSEMHEAGVVHNNVTADNIIVDDNSGGGAEASCGTTTSPSLSRLEHNVDAECDDDDGRRVSIKIIDLGSAVVLKENDPTGTTRAIGNDLASLGKIYSDMFLSGYDDDRHRRDGDGDGDMEGGGNGGGPRASMRTTMRGEVQHDPSSAAFHQGRIPRCIYALLAKLMGGGDGDGGGYTSAGRGHRACRDVELDLSQILDFPDRFLATDRRDDVAGGMTGGGVLQFPPDRLYGRTMETTVLLDSFSRVATTPRGRSEVVLIAGISGSGKSSLVRRVREPLIARGGYLLSGKFDSLQQVEALSAVIDAFNEFCQLVVEGGAGTHLDVMRATILDKVGLDGASVLVDLIPGLRHLLRVDPGTNPAVRVGGKEAQNRLKHVFRLLVRAMATPSHPLVLFLDDLQWADQASLDLIRALVTDHEGGSLLFVGCYRDNEVDGAHPLAVQLRDIEGQGVPVTKIKIGSIGRDAMNHLVSDTLLALRSCTTPLTDAVFFKTRGNAFFAVEYLTSLCAEGLLRYSDECGLWVWDIEGIRVESKNVASTAFGLVVNKILKLPAQVKGALQVAACLGHHCEESTLCIVADEEEAGVAKSINGISNTPGCSSTGRRSSLSQMLDVAARQGLMERIGHRYEFVHDQIQHAAYASIPEYEKGMLHLRIGKRIWKKSPPPKLEELLLVAVDQLYLGSMFVDQSDGVDLARLYLRAGKKAMASSLFLPAATYLKAGIDLLESCHWDREYDLSLQLHACCAETYFLNGNASEMQQVLDEIFANAKCFEDKVGAYGTLVNSLGALDKLQDAIKTSFLVLEELGEHFPDPEDASHQIIPNWLDTRDLLDEFTDETLVTMKVMDDKRKIAAMGFLKNLIMKTYMAAPQYLPLVTFRMMQVTLRHGLCKESAFGFAMYGITCISCEPFKDINRGYAFGQVALQLLERCDCKASVAQVYQAVYGNINHWKEPLRHSLEPYLRGHQIGLMVGDIEYGMANARMYCQLSFQSGKELAPLEEEMRVFCDRMAQYNQMSMLAILSVTRQVVQNLMGLSDDPLRLTGEAMNQDQVFGNAIAKKHSLLVCCIYYHRMWLAYYFSDYELAAELAEKCQNVDENCTSEFDVPNHAFFDGLNCLALARKTEDSKLINRSKKALVRLKICAAHAPCNFLHKVDLLEAEMAFLSEARSLAEKKYESAIMMAGENGFVNDQALACERAAGFYLEIGDKSIASEYYDRAHDLYLEWGARGKALHLRGQSLSCLMADAT